MCVKSMRKLAALSVFRPTRALVSQNELLDHKTRKGLMDVLPSLPTVRFIKMVDADPISAMKFLAGVPPTVKVVSAWSHLVGATGRKGPPAVCALYSAYMQGRSKVTVFLVLRYVQSIGV